MSLVEHAETTARYNEWMNGRPFDVRSLDRALYASFDERWAERRRADPLTEERLAAPISYGSTVNPKERTRPLWLTVVHCFDHQTHHRGQLTTLLSQIGVDFGVTDLVRLPGVELPRGDQDRGSTRQ